MSNLQAIIEEINELTKPVEEDTLVDQFDDAVIEGEPGAVNTMQAASTTEKLDARTKISRAFDTFRAAATDFDAVVLENADLLSDATIINLKDEVLNKLDELANAIDPNASKEEVQPELPADDFNAELPTEQSPAEEEQEEDELPEQDFDSAAEIDFGI